MNRNLRIRLRAGTAALTAAALTLTLTIDPAAVAASASGLQTRAEGFSDAIAALGSTEAAAAVPLTGSWAAPGAAGAIPEIGASLPDEDEQLVVLTEEGARPASLGAGQSSTGTPTPDPVTVDLGGMEVTVAPDGAAATPAAVLLRVAGDEETDAAGITGVLLDVTDASADPVPDSGVELTLSYATFAGLVSGDWASRLRFVWIPECAGGGPCTPLPLDTVNDPATQTVTAVVPVAPSADGARPASLRTSQAPGRLASGSGGGGSLAVTADSSGSEGDWGATSLSQSSTWGSAGSTGAFTWSLPIGVPTAPAGPAPELTISYSSGSIDGRTPSTNNQSGTIGEGFALTEGYVERSYTPCSRDEEGAANNIGRVTGDLCWGAENATLMLNGTAVELVRDAPTGQWHPKNEDGSVIERVTGSSWNAGQADEYWKLTTSDGTRYYFGRGKTSANGPALNSAWTVPVYGNHPGEPCYHATFSDSACTQVWRWNLDYVVDVSGNSMSYFYDAETNRYIYDVTGNTAGASVAYVSGGHVDRIEYGTRVGSENVANAPAKVVFDYGPRCITNLTAPNSFCSNGQSSTSENHWLDTPTDLVCTSSVPGECGSYTPVFFDLTRLRAVSTFAYDGAAYAPVDAWVFGQTFEGEGAGVDLAYASNVTLVLRSVTHTGKGGTASTSDDITGSPFLFTYDFLENRIATDALVLPLLRPRMIGIRTDSGAQVSVNYATDCGPGDVPGISEPAQAANARLCFPVKWYPGGTSSALTEYFHKWVVQSIVESGAAPVAEESEELITGSVAKVTAFGYGDGAAWAKPTGAMVKPDEVTYSDFRGVKTVTTTIGIGADATSMRSTYYRGTGGTLTAGPSGSTVSALDREEYQGQVFVSTTLNGVTPVSDTVTTFGVPVVTGTSAAGVKSTRLPSQTTDGFGYDAAGALTHHTRQTRSFDANSQVSSVDDRGDLTTSADNTCTTMTYAAASNGTLAAKHLVALVSETQVISVACGTSPALPGDLISDTTSSYDDFGRVERTDRLDPADGVGSILVSRVLSYDDRGRPLEVSDPFGNVTTTAYQEAAGGLTQTVTTTGPDPDGWGPLSGFQTVTHLNPLTGLVTSTVDTNGLVTSGSYDALGRLLTVRRPQHQSTPLPSVAYEYRVDPNGLNSVVTRTLAANGSSQLVSVTLYDGLLRVFQTQTSGRDAGAGHDASAADRGRMVTHTYYDSAGRVARQAGRWWAEGAPTATPIVPIPVPPSLTTYDYDAAGRVVAEIFWVGTDSNPANERWRTVTAYDGDTTLVIPPLGKAPQGSTVDALGRVVARTEYLRDPDLDAAADTPVEVLALPHQATNYEYDVAGRLVKMRDSANHIWTYDYDWGGRLVASDDPDGGTTTTSYDEADRVVTRTNGNGDTLAYTYDVLGRTTTLRDDTVNGTIRAQWQYDQSLDENDDPVLGQLSSTTRFVDGAAYTTSVDRYDAAYRTLATTLTLPNLPEYADALAALSFTTKYSYTADGQLASVMLPAIVSHSGTKALGAEAVTTRFDAASVPSWMGGGFGWGTYVAESRVGADGRVSGLDLGNTYGAYVTFQYETGTERLANISLTRQNHGLGLSLNYGYDQAGNVTSIFDQASPLATGQDNQCFGYDGLSRLTVAWSSTVGNCGVAQSALTTADVGGTSPYWTEYAYDALGNRTQMLEHAVGGGSDTTTSYTHGGSGFGPHQLASSVKTTGGSSTATSFAYDDAGNRASSTTGGATTDYQWDAEGKLVGVDGAEYVYDVSGGRTVRADASGTTVYLPGGQELVISSAGVVSATRYYTFSGQLVAVRTSRGLGGVASLVVDHQGSVVAAVPNTDWGVGSARVVRTDPFGGARDGSDAGVPGDKGFLGLTRDESTSLSLLGARYYEPASGVFLSVDPVLDPAIPAQLNAYQYGWNNPVTCSDPSGQKPLDGYDGSSKGLGKGKSGPQPPPKAQFDPFKTLIRGIVQLVVQNPPYVQFTQHPGDGVGWFNFWGFDRAADGAYHSNKYGWQQYVGYNDTYDVAFDLGTSMEPHKFEFEYNDKSYVLWAWKGDYLNLGTGAELGLYSQDNPLSEKGFFWQADPDVALPMSMTLDYRGATIGSYSPAEKQWWCTTFVPAVQDPALNDIHATFTVDFSGDTGMFEAFQNEWHDSSYWNFDTKNHTATLRYRRKKKVRR
ncbi:MAG: hypothetical protein BGO94_11640 [Micrococcales bacterium 72-143]|nr:MAG: hypothetical protein BGO94_11640 [Micrococcales bacterium 72-143]